VLRDLRFKEQGSKERVTPMKLSFVPLLLGGRSLSPEARSALIENRRADAAVLLMQQFDLNCREAGELVDVPICDEEKSPRAAHLPLLTSKPLSREAHPVARISDN
jgi:hypothetical protein